MSQKLHELSVAEAGRRMRAGTLTSAALTDYTLQRIAALDPLIDSFVTVTADVARARAAAADADFQRGVDRGPMQGVPYALKDIFDTAGIRTTYHSALMKDHVPVTDCAIEERLKAQGAVLIGKTATHEFALGGPSFDLPFPPARNPWNRDCIPGGSSSGSAAAVAAGFVRVAYGTDTGASIRGPAAYCGVVGFKPTYGLVSAFGAFPLSPSLDHCGPIAANVEDAAIAFNAVVGCDPRDPTSVGVERLSGVDFDRSLEGLTIGVPRRYYAGKASADTEAAIERTLDLARDSGANIVDVALPDFEVLNAIGRVIMLTEAFSTHSHAMRRRPSDFGLFTYLRLAMGALTTGEELSAAYRLRRLLTEEMTRALSGCDAVITAVSLGPAPRFDDAPPGSAPPVAMQTMPFNVTGFPAVAIPTFLSKSELPLSLQVVGTPLNDLAVLQIAREVELLLLNTGESVANSRDSRIL